VSLRWPVAPMVARSAAELPAGDHWSYETKFDGFRCIALRHDTVQLQSCQLRPLTLAFPDVVEAVSALPPGTVVDGELVVMVDGRVDFSALQRRATSHRVEAPAMLAVFDLLAHRGEDLRPLPYQERRDRLEQLLGRRHPGLCLVPITRDRVGAAAWMRHGDRGIEGAVAKRRDQGYLPARNSWLKVRAKTTSEAVVGGVVGSPRRPAGLILGRQDRRGRFGVVGRSLPLRREQREVVGQLLARPAGEHPWPTVLPGGRFGLPGGEPVEYIPVEPAVVVEIETDSCFELGRYRHPVKFLRVRTELRPDDLPSGK
jgi:ATP-dependent DNA ligase